MHIIPSEQIGSACVQSLVGLPGILSMEEEEAYQKYETTYTIILSHICVYPHILRKKQMWNR